MDDEKVLAEVMGKKITEQDLINALMRYPEDRQQAYMNEQGKQQLLEQVVDFELIYNFALDEKMDNDEAFIQQLENVKKEVLIQYAINKVLSDIRVTENEAQEFYKDNMSMFLEEESVRASHILVDTLEKAEDVATKLKEGKDFAEAAKEYSSCPSNERGGDLGYFKKGSMVPEFEKAAFALKVGEVSEPVKTQFGYHIIKLEDRKEPGLAAFEDVKEPIVNNIVNQKQNGRYLEVINALKSKYKVEYK
ncbi:peptidylprolyl isomerase [Clostridium oryzae]|uniref:Foldase protein PrsA n=1 Tax=Clostridium oryzae TaxID=1450648 RepID=A0A1V4I688_9CLOT|nr:peptidylprolyl isomerase [Clostridium oryzae]OPJ55502.1 foldase protein PrsA precursor [Clostridium oryzae]